MDRNEIRFELFNLLKENRNTSFASVRGHFTKRLGKPIAENEHLEIMEVIQELIHNNVLMEGIDWSNDHFPWLRLTDYGLECVQEENLLPFDPEGYIREIKNQIPQLDEVTLSYLGESITTYNKNCLLSATITLGAASEQVILELIETFAKAVKDSTQKNKFKKQIENKFIFTKYKIFQDKFETIRNKLPSELIKNIDIYLGGIFNFIRLNRNQTGHPTGLKINKKIICSNLQIFAEYSKKIYSLIEWFKNNKV